ncbi:unnamed protein product [Rotaria magnacalcarata]|uniref:Uncharacterized protein n=1 Tax=Rotaria magnacalcarata TaxID=392030 RepID=A0A816ZAK2_9BILA|nr:unnamed protein product [Rotaria magnacalcarata]CAF3835776.1 unnamed protein product [Rotaria magnacalcarata]
MKKPIDLHFISAAVIACCQLFLFFFLLVIGFCFGVSYVESDRFQYASYSFTHVRLAELKTTLANGCSNLTDLPCSLQMSIDVYFFWTKFVLVYYSWIIIHMIYTWHRTVRLSSCYFALFVIIIFIFGTDLILYFDRIFVISSSVCLIHAVLGSYLEALMPHSADDQLHELCERISLPNILNESLHNGHSKRARFYRWAKKMKKEWNIKEEKLIITAITNIIVTIVIISIRSYMFK